MLWLTDQEIDDLCAGLQRKADRLKYLVGLGLNVKCKPNGEPLVLRSNVEAVLGGVPQAAGKTVVRPAGEPDRAALVAHFKKQKKVTA